MKNKSARAILVNGFSAFISFPVSESILLKQNKQGPNFVRLNLNNKKKFREKIKDNQLRRS
ncbi:hypothetical protein [Oceanobacillus kapialis]|uniref:Uncharacterized protein n=1 Tax=Oceanobacillus kapialis TaxID=481353 RepID=A0ABW5PVL4_9BACI